MTVFGSTTLSLALRKAKPAGMTEAQVALSNKDSQAWTDGTGLNNLEVLYQNRLTIAASGMTQFLLSAGLVDFCGDTIDFTTVRLVYVKNRSAIANIEVRTNIANGWTNFMNGAHILGPNGILYSIRPDATGWVTPIGASILEVGNLDGVEQAEFDIVIAGND